MGKRNTKALKKTIKYLSICKNPELISHIIARSPDNVVKSICNATLNAAKGQVVLTQKQKRILASNRDFVEKLIHKGESAQKKKQFLVQKGGGPLLGLIIPTVLGAVLSSLGSKLFT